MSRARPSPPALSSAERVRAYARRQLRSALTLVAPLDGPPGPRCQDLHALARFEPRLLFAARQVRDLARAAGGGRRARGPRPTVVVPRRLGDWLASFTRQPELASPYTSVLQYLSGPCAVACPFCLHRNDPPGRWTRGPRWRRSRAEVLARLEHYAPAHGRALFRTQDYAFYEPVTHPDFLPLLTRLRARTDRLVGFTTNGAALTQDLVGRLAALGPLHLMVSANDLGETACFEELASRGISFSVSVVVRREAPSGFLAAVLRRADAADAYLIRVNLPGFSRHFAAAAPQAPSFRSELVQLVDELRPSLRAPVLFQPSHLDLGERPSAQALVAGTVRNSPAETAGVRRGDRLVSVDGEPVRHRAHALRLLGAYRRLGVERVILVVERSGRTCQVELEESFAPLAPGQRSPRYPHQARLDAPGSPVDPTQAYGVVLQPTLDPDWLTALRGLLERRGARRVLLCSSELLAPLVRRLLADDRPFRGLDVRVDVAVPRNEHFLGGDVLPGDLLVAEDFAACIRSWPGRLDLALVPRTAFGPFGHDLTGRPWLDVERLSGVPVDLMPCDLISAI